MGKDERQRLIDQLDNELLRGGVMLSEWATFLIRDADLAYVCGADISCILTSLAAIETHLRSDCGTECRERLIDLINASGLPEKLRDDLHLLRQYRNRWVHVDNPLEDSGIQADPAKHEKELQDMATLAIKCLRNVIYANQWV